MNTIRTWLQGKKTYLSSLSAALASLLLYVEGTIDVKTFGAAVIAAILACTIGAKIDRAAK